VEVTFDRCPRLFGKLGPLVTKNKVDGQETKKERSLSPLDVVIGAGASAGPEAQVSILLNATKK
jgi:hypothetical protein